MRMAARTRAGSLQLATDTWRAPDGRTVTLIGMSHAAHPSFYAAVERQIAICERRGAEVHYEMLKMPSATIPSALTDQEQDWVNRLRAVNTLPVIADLLGLSMQKQIAVEPHWRNTDTDILTLFSRLDDPERWISSMEAAAKALGGLDKEVASMSVGWVLRHLPMLSRMLSVRAWFSRSVRRDRRVFLDDRNLIAVEAALSAPGDVVATWGAAHLPGIGKGLRAAGFRHVDRQWTVALGKRMKRIEIVPSPTADEGAK